MADEDFPRNLVNHLGYHVSITDKRTLWRGAFNQKEPLAVRKGFPTDDADAQSV
ncbi:exonuclease III [Actinobacillus equuli]|nr:exonuclease III [Actinobacillus equuli]